MLVFGAFRNVFYCFYGVLTLLSFPSQIHPVYFILKRSCSVPRITAKGKSSDSMILSFHDFNDPNF